MNKNNQGIMRRYRVYRLDGSSRKGEKHHNCKYFVLDLDHDRHAIPALLAYADSCEKEFPALAFDLRLAARLLRGKTG